MEQPTTWALGSQHSCSGCKESHQRGRSDREVVHSAYLLHHLYLQLHFVTSCIFWVTCCQAGGWSPGQVLRHADRTSLSLMSQSIAMATTHGYHIRAAHNYASILLPPASSPWELTEGHGDQTGDKPTTEIAALLCVHWVTDSQSIKHKQLLSPPSEVAGGTDWTSSQSRACPEQPLFITIRLTASRAKANSKKWVTYSNLPVLLLSHNNKNNHLVKRLVQMIVEDTFPHPATLCFTNKPSNSKLLLEADLCVWIPKPVVLTLTVHQSDFQSF